VWDISEELSPIKQRINEKIGEFDMYDLDDIVVWVDPLDGTKGFIR
jgi:3'-phosphoadenosine 5'-phosphosulfate (PAPS) 3'-phosphatase